MQWVIPHLIKDGHTIVGVDNFSRYGITEIKRDYKFYQYDLTDKKNLNELCNGVDIIIQAAAQIYGVKGFHKYAADILSRDVTLHQNLLWEAVKSKMFRFIYISSSMVYERSEKVPVSEDDVNDMRIPMTDYGLSKLVGERLCKAFFKQYGLKYTIWRPFNIITPYEKGEQESGISHVFADFMRKIIIKKQNPLEILGNGKQIRCFTWIDDVAKAIAKYSLLDETECEEFNLGNPEPVSMEDLANRIYKKAVTNFGFNTPHKKLTFKYIDIYNDDVQVRVPSIDKAQSILNWNPKVMLDEALDKCIKEVLCSRKIIS